jgi:hypothetical protein
MKRFWSVFGVGAVLLAGPSPCFGQLPVRNPAVRILIPADANSHPATGSQTVYLVAGGLGAGAFVGSGGSWVALERRVSTQPVLWNFLGNTSVGDNTWEAIVEVMSFYHGSHRIAGAYGVISWPEVTLRFYYRCSYGGANYRAYIRVGAGTRVGILGGHPTSDYSLGYEILDTVVVRCSDNETNAVEGAWVSDSYAGRWFDIESLLSTNQVGARVVTNRISVGDLTVREVVVNVDSNTVTTVNVLSNEVVSVLGATGTAGQQVMGSIIGGANVRSVGGGTGASGEVQVSVTVTNEVNVDWSEGYEYSRGQLVSTNWTWVLGSVQSSVADALGEPGSLPGVSVGHGAAAPTWTIPLRMPSGVWSWEFDLGVWTGRLGGLVKRLLEVFVLVGLWLVLHRQIVDDLRSAWQAPQARTAGQTVLGTGSQLGGALLAAAAILATLLTLSAAMLGWFLGGVGYPTAWVGDLSLPSGLLLEFLRVGPWEVIVSSLTVWISVWLARPYWIALTHAAVRFITGV